jgi:hypothetical protein
MNGVGSERESPFRVDAPLHDLLTRLHDRTTVGPRPGKTTIAYLFTEWKYNLDCHYRWAFENSVLTNSRLLRPLVTDRLADAGVATLNFAGAAVGEKPGLPKALNPIGSYFHYLLKRQYRYGYTVFFNMNICKNNLVDVRRLTEIARDHAIATDHHINESPILEQPHFQHASKNPAFIGASCFLSNLWFSMAPNCKWRYTRVSRARVCRPCARLTSCIRTNFD